MSKIFDYALTQVSDDIKRFIDNSFDISNQILAILESQGKTQRDLANLLGKSESEISKWMKGTHNFTLKSLSKIEVVLNEKIITTPFKFRQDAFARAANALAIFNKKTRSFASIPKHAHHPVFVEISKSTISKKEKKEKNEKNNEQQSYAMVA